jgi:hypothetical protein
MIVNKSKSSSTHFTRQSTTVITPQQSTTTNNSITNLQLICQLGNHTTNMSIGRIILSILNMIFAQYFSNSDVVVAFPLVEGYFAQEFLFVVF